MLKDFFIPNKHNHYTPHLLQKKALVVYLLVAFMLNFVFVKLPAFSVKAEVSANRLYELHNEQRASHNLPSMKINTALVESANKKAVAMLASDCWSHYCPNGESPWQFFDEAGYGYVYAGENLAEGFDDDAAVMNAWMNSPTHRANILKPEFDEIGIGFARGNFQGIANNTIVVVHFGSRTEKLAGLPLSNTINVNESTLQISEPKDGAYINTPVFDIKGTADAGSQVGISANNTELGKIIAGGGEFTFRSASAFTDGSYDLKASEYNTGGTVTSVSQPVSIVIDTQAPQFVPSGLSVTALSSGSDEIVVMSVKVTGSPDSVKSSNLNLAFTKISDDDWEGEISKSSLAGASSMVLEAIDRAGNQSRTEIPMQTVLARVLSLEASLPSQSGQTLPISISALFSGKDLKTKLNLVLVAFMAALFLIDFYVLAKSGLTGVERSKSHLHFTNLVLIFVLIIFGGLSGSILSGTNIIK
jgi:hypothetical protein